MQWLCLYKVQTLVEIFYFETHIHVSQSNFGFTETERLLNFLKWCGNKVEEDLKVEMELRNGNVVCREADRALHAVRRVWGGKGFVQMGNKTAKLLFLKFPVQLEVSPAIITQMYPSTYLHFIAVNGYRNI